MNSTNDRGGGYEFFAVKIIMQYEDKVDPCGKIDDGKTKIVAYLDSTLNAVHRWEKSDAKHGCIMDADLCGHFLAGSSESPFPEECRVCFQTFKRLKNEFGKLCWLDFGAVNVPFVKIVNHQRRALVEGQKDSWFEVKLKMHTVSSETMGIIKVRLSDECEVKSSEGNSSLLPLRKTEQQQQQRQRHQQSYTEYGDDNDKKNNFTQNAYSFAEGSFFITENPFELEFDDVVIEGNYPYLQTGSPTQTAAVTVAVEPIVPLATAVSPISLVQQQIKRTEQRERRQQIAILKVSSKCFDNSKLETQNKTSVKFGVSSTSYVKKLSSASIAGRVDKGLGRLVFEKHQLDLYFEEYERENAYFKDWITGADNINCPFYPSQVTLMDTRIFLPYVAYALYEPSLVSQTYWMDALKIASSRRGFDTLDEYCNAFLDDSKTSLESRAIQAMDMVCQLAHTMEYIADQVVDPVTKEVKKIEIFGDALFTSNGDCDDLASAVFQMFDDFSLRQRFHVVPSASGTALYAKVIDVLILMQTILKRYVPFMCIEGVTSASAQNQHDIEETVITGAHAAIKCLPLWYVQKCVANWNPNHPIADSSKRISFGVNTSHVPGGPFNYVPFAVKTDSNNNEKDTNSWEKDLPVLIGEGTGMLNSGGEKDPCPLAGFRRYVYASKATKCSKKHLYPPKGTSPFYVAILFASTNRFVECGVGTFRFCVKTPDGDFRRGVLFPDLVAMKEDVCIVPYGDAKDHVKFEPVTTAGSSSSSPPPPPSSSSSSSSSNAAVIRKRPYRKEFTNTQLHILREALKTRLKPKPVVSFNALFSEGDVVIPIVSGLNLSALSAHVRNRIEGSLGFARLNELRDRLISNVLRKWGKRDKSYVLAEEEGRVKVSIYYDDEYITEDTVGSLLEHFKRENVIMKYAMENHTATTWQWRLTFMYKPSSLSSSQSTTTTSQ